MGILLSAVLFLLLTAGPGLAAQSIDEAYQFYRNEQWAEAAELLSRRVERGQARPGEMALLGMCYINMGELEKAEEVIGAAYMLAPNTYSVLLARGNLALGKEEFTAAERAFLEAAELRPERREAVQGAGLAAFAGGVRLMQEGSYEDALPYLRRAAKKLRGIGARDEERVLPALIATLRHTGRRGELLAAYRRYLELRPDSADARAGLGLLLYEWGEISGALKELQRAVDADTSDPEPYLILARRALGRGEREEAGLLLQEAIGKAVRLYSMYRVQAARTMKQAQSKPPDESAAGVPSPAAAPAPADTADGSVTTAAPSAGSGVPDTAEAPAGSGSEGGRQNPQMQQAQVRSLRELAESAERPRGILREALELLPSAYERKENLRKDLRRLVRWYPSAAEVRAMLADELDAAGLHQEARAQWRELIERAAFYHRAHLGLGSSYEREGNGRMALRSYRRALDLAPGDPEVYHKLRHYYRSRGGMEAYRRLLEEQLLKEGYNLQLLQEAAAAAEETGAPEKAAEYRQRAKEIREYRARAAAEESAAEN
jgi:tetratricopeptide (TPR) repeat protein